MKGLWEDLKFLDKTVDLVTFEVRIPNPLDT